MEKLITKIDNIFKEPEQFKKIVFVTPKPIHVQPDPVLFDFSQFNPCISITEEVTTNVIPLLNNYKRLILEQQQFNITNTVWDYVALLYKTRKVILNNSHIFKYSTITHCDDDDEGINSDSPVLSSSSLDFELVMTLYMIASKEQSLVDDCKTDNQGNKNNTIHLLNAKTCLEEAHLIAKDCCENLENITYDDTSSTGNKPYDLLSYKKHINDIKTDHISNEDSLQYLIKSNTSSCSNWINDIGGLELMKARSIIAYCQANENFYKAIKYTNKDSLSKMNLSFSISGLYKDIVKKNGLLSHEKFSDNNIKKFSKFMYYYWIYNAHRLAFKLACHDYCNCDNEKLLEYYDERSQIPLEINRYNALDKYYNKIIKIITNNKNLTWYKPIIEKKKSSITRVYNDLIKVLNEWNLSTEIGDTLDESLDTFDVLYCTTLSSKITFKSFIDKAFTRLQNVKNFIDFCDNKYNIGNNSTTTTPPLITTEVDGGIKHEDIIKLKEVFQQKLLKWEKDHSVLKNDSKFIIGKIDSDLRWMIFFVSLFEHDKSITDIESFNILKRAVNKFIEQ